MSEHLRISSPLSSSPGRPSALSRPAWPWTQLYNQRGSQSSIHSSTSVTSSHTPWDQRSSLSTSSPSSQPTTVSWHPAARHNTGSTMGAFSNTAQGETTRQWTFNAFEWIVRDVHKLKDYVEGQELVGAEEGTSGTVHEHDDFEILKESPMIGDGKFKLEIARTPLAENASSPDVKSQPPTISLYITSLMLDFPHSDFAISASMMTAIKCQDDRVGERGARAEWVWEHWQSDWTFRHESEVWECPLPPLSLLLETPRIKETDSFVLCVQIHCPIGPFFPQQPSAYYVPRDLLDGLEASLDNANTGDVRFICFERLNRQQPQPSPNLSPSMSARSASTSSSYSPFSSQTTARKRVLYAHADILMRRCEYFSTMLSSAFQENSTSLSAAERKVYTVVVEEADFVTIYWLLKWVYANWLLFKEHDDPRDAVDGVGAGWSANWLNARGGEWDWKTFRKANPGDDGAVAARDDARSTTSADSGNAPVGDKGKHNYQPGAVPSSSSVRPPPGPRTPSSKGTTGSSTTSRQPSTSRRSGQASISGNPSAMTISLPESTSSLSRSKPVPIALSVSTSNFTSPHYPISPRSQRQQTHPPSALSSPDPHLHPTPAPEPASALSMYQVAHRYAMPGLASLALEHIMTTITPQSSFPFLLATSVWDELHSLVEDYVVDKWDEVSVSEEFEQCCQEVAAGEWGCEGGKTLMTLFRRLRSPSTASYTRS